MAGEPESRAGTGDNARKCAAEADRDVVPRRHSQFAHRALGMQPVGGASAATATSRPGRSCFSIDRAASVCMAWPAGPLLVGRWCWNELGSDPNRLEPETSPPRLAALPYSPGSRLGNLVLAAQQNIGRGTVVALGEAACLSNDGIPFSVYVLRAATGRAGR